MIVVVQIILNDLNLIVWPSENAIKEFTKQIILITIIRFAVIHIVQIRSETNLENAFFGQKNCQNDLILGNEFNILLQDHVD